MFSDEQIEELVDLLSSLSTDTKIYIGCDSIRYVKNQEQFARYATVAIVHKNGNNGCKLFKNISHEKDYDANEKRPKLRLMNEVMKVCELYNQLYAYIDEYDIEIHLDINTDPKHNSSNVAQAAAGYVLGVTGIQPRLKPDSWAASFGADGVVRGMDERPHRNVRH